MPLNSRDAWLLCVASGAMREDGAITIENPHLRCSWDRNTREFYLKVQYTLMVALRDVARAPPWVRLHAHITLFPPTRQLTDPRLMTAQQEVEIMEILTTAYDEEGGFGFLDRTRDKAIHDHDDLPHRILVFVADNRIFGHALTKARKMIREWTGVDWRAMDEFHMSLDRVVEVGPHVAHHLPRHS